MKISRIAVFLLVVGLAFARAPQRYAVKGMVLKVDAEHGTMLISCDSIPGVMDAMAMPFTVRDTGELTALRPGMKVEFTLVSDKNSSFAEGVTVLPFESLELDPTQARRLKIIEDMVKSAPAAVKVGDAVPDFRLTDEKQRPVALSEFHGKVVAITFVYTRCPFPNYCFRLSNNFGQLQKRFRQRMGTELVLLSVVIDPAHEGPQSLDNYARIWQADGQGWHFLTGSLPQIQDVCRKFDMNFYPDEALYVHSFHTVLLDRQTKLAANLEGNDFSAQQLGDLVETLLTGKN
jgi:protein SCO1/2